MQTSRFFSLLLTFALFSAFIQPMQAGDEIPPASDLDQRLYDGKPLSQWRETIKSLNFQTQRAREAVPGLLEIMQDDELPAFTRRQAALTLGRIRKPARQTIPILIEYLQEPSQPEDTVLWSAKALALFEDLASEAAPILIQRMQDPTRSFAERITMLEPISRIGAAHPQVLPALTQALRIQPGNSLSLKEAELFRALAAESLAYLGADASSAVPALIRAMEDPGELVRRRAVTAIGSVGPAARIAILPLADALTLDPSPSVKEQAVIALAAMGQPAVPVLIQLTQDREVDIRWRAAQGLGLIGKPAVAAQPSLLKLTKDPHPTARLHALRALWSITGDQSLLFPQLLEELATDQRDPRVYALDLLLEVAPKSPSVLQQLESMATDPRSHVSRTAKLALRKLDEKSSDKQ